MVAGEDPPDRSGATAGGSDQEPEARPPEEGDQEVEGRPPEESDQEVEGRPLEGIEEARGASEAQHEPPTGGVQPIGPGRPDQEPDEDAGAGNGSRATGDTCLNCGDPSPGEYCRTCGQRRGDPRAPLARLATDLLDDQFSLNARLPVSVGALLFRPGFLTEEYFAGRIARYIRPVRLYLLSSVVFFLLLTLLGMVALERGRVMVGDLDLTLDAVRDSILNDPALRGDAARRDSVMANLESLRSAAGAGRASGARVTERLQVSTALPDEVDARIEQRVDELRSMPPERAVRLVVRDSLNRAPVVVFLLLPMFALILKVLYRGRFYVEHFVFALHLHAFWFLAFTLMLTFRYPLLTLLLGVWVLLYVFLAMKRFYRESALRTTLKYALLASVYPTMVLVGVLGTLLAALAFA